jgi:aryl-alcohol dehydrogenase-like predicted oxidoreductase
MQFRNLGASGLRVSVVGLGCNNFGGKLDQAGTNAVVDKAIDSGVTFFDCADTYGLLGGGQKGAAEICLGVALGSRRKDIVLATKFGHVMDAAETLKGGSRRYIMAAIEASLTRLKTDWIDLYQLHGPDPLTPIDETMRALDDLIRQGKVRYVGCSNLSAWLFVQAQWTAKAGGLTPFITCQNHYSLVHRVIEKELVPAANAHGASILPFYPLASGLLTGKYRKDAPPPAGARLASNNSRFAQRHVRPDMYDKVEALRAFGEARGLTLLEIAMSWLAAQPHVGSIIAGATSPDQVAANVAAAGKSLSAEDLTEIDRIAP